MKVSARVCMKMAIIERGEKLLPSDKEETGLPAEYEPLRSEPRGFAPDQMLRCESCLRANPPTRTSCLYCAAQLPTTEASAAVQRPTLRRLEKWEPGFNVILIPGDGPAKLSEEALREAALTLRLSEHNLSQIMLAQEPLPLARAAAHDEAALVGRKLGEMNVRTLVVADAELGLGGDSTTTRARALGLTESDLVAHPAGGGEFWSVWWSDVVLLVAGRHLVREIEVEERRGRRSENEIVDARDLVSDESVLDIYFAQSDSPLRINSANFDYSCLGQRKGLLASQNFSSLIEILHFRASGALYDDTYNRVRQLLDNVWPLEQRTESRGWRRKMPGQVTTEAVTRSDNETQFTRYSRLRRYLQQHQRELSA